MGAKVDKKPLSAKMSRRFLFCFRQKYLIMLNIPRCAAFYLAIFPYFCKPKENQSII